VVVVSLVAGLMLCSFSFSVITLIGTTNSWPSSATP
jgi:hypothetical protein